MRRSIALLLTTTNWVSANDNESFAVCQINEATMGVVRGDGSNAFAAYSKVRKRWSTHHFPDELTIRPWTLGEFSEDNKDELVVAFELAGGPVTELVAVDCKGRFRVHKLDTSVNAALKPMLNGNGIIYYIVDEAVHAFSGKTGTWGSYKVPGLPDVRWVDDAGQAPSIQEHGFDTESEEGILIRRPNGVAKFMADKGVWQFIPSDSKVGG